MKEMTQLVAYMAIKLFKATRVCQSFEEQRRRGSRGFRTAASTSIKLRFVHCSQVLHTREQRKRSFSFRGFRTVASVHIAARRTTTIGDKRRSEDVRKKKQNSAAFCCREDV
ncbi:hypothetical protein MRB53_035515 [Persea americana]|uniref:Uncharacterized protein n=1 Tax=Persea americana TaxID=3435 RepID=A0ACC2K564_PERAE|nr:hypothetical protein MRB53_035515 [Persea americana]